MLAHPSVQRRCVPPPSVGRQPCTLYSVLSLRGRGGFECTTASSTCPNPCSCTLSGELSVGKCGMAHQKGWEGSQVFTTAGLRRQTTLMHESSSSPKKLHFSQQGQPPPCSAKILAAPGSTFPAQDLEEGPTKLF